GGQRALGGRRDGVPAGGARRRQHDREEDRAEQRAATARVARQLRAMRIHAPMAMKPRAAMTRRCCAGTHWPTWAPTRTARPEATTRAAADAMKTPSLLTAGLVAKTSVASWVLSPSSASSTLRNTTA